MEKNDEENELEPTEESNNSQETDEGGDTNNNSDSSSDNSEQGNGFYENLGSESLSTVIASENIQTVDQDREGIDQDELERAIDKELEEGVKVIAKYLEKESEFIKAYQEMVGKERAIDEVRELKGEGRKMTDEEWEKEVKIATYNAELIYESMEKTEIKPINEEIPENKEDLEIEKEIEQSEEISEPQLSDLKEDVREQEKELEQIYEGREPPLEQHQVEPFIKEELETVPEPIINEKEAEKLQELDIEEQFETVHLNEFVDELVEKEELDAEQLKEQVEKEALEAQTSKIKEANSELYEVVEVERDGLDQHEVEATIAEALKTEPEPIINEKEVEKLQELDIEEQFETVHLNEYVDELVERQDEDKNIENDKIEQEKENIEQTQEVIHQSTYLQEKLEEQERELELKYEEKDVVEQHQVEAAIEEELKTEPKSIINEEELEYLKNLKLEEQLGAEFFYGFIEKLANRQNEEKEECEEKEEHEEISTEEKVAQIMRELEIPQEINSDENKVEVNSQEGGLEQETNTPDEEMVEQREIEEYKDHQQELEEILEQNRKIEQEALKEIELGEEDLDKTIEKNYEKAKNLYKQQTGKRPIYANKETKGFKQWLEQKKKSEEKEKTKQKKELKEEQKKEETWKWSMKNWIERAAEIDSELKSELKKLVEEYDELEKLIKKYSQLYKKEQCEKLSQAEKNELRSLIKGLQKLSPIKSELFLGVREIKRYLDEQYYYDFWDKTRVNQIRSHFFTHLSQKNKSLKQAQNKKENSEEVLRNWIEQASEEEISPELKVKLKEIAENYSELEELATMFMKLYTKEQREYLSKHEKQELKFLIKTLEKRDPINILLFANIRAIKHYLNDQHLDDFSDKARVNRVISKLFKHISQKMLKLKELINVKYEIIQKPRVFASYKLALTDYNLDDYCRIVVNYIKNKIGIDHDNFNNYFEILREMKVNILRDVLSDTTILNFMKIGNIDPSKKRNLDQAKNCCQVIALALLNCSNYKCLFNKFKDVSGLQDRQTRALIKKYIPLLNSINPKLDIKIWMPKKKSPLYTFDKIKQIVEKAGKQRTGKNGILLNPKNSEEFEDLKRKYKKRASQLPLRVKCGRCGHEWNTTISNIVQSKTKTYSWCTNCIKPEYYSFDNIKHTVYDTIIKFIKNEIGANHNRFDEYIRLIEEKKIDSNIIIKKMLSNQILKEIIKEACVSVHSKSQYHIKRCLQVISLALIKCKNYDVLLEELLKLIDLTRDVLVKTIVKYITCLGEIYNFNVNHWLPKEVHAPYTFSEIKSYIMEKGWMLLSPKNQNEFNDLKKNTGGSNISLVVHCGNPEHLEWKSSFRSLFNNNSNCPDCSNNVRTYSQIKHMVKNLSSKMSDKEGILIHPESNEKFLQIRRDKGRQPSLITLIVSCGIQKHHFWKTNVANLSQERWCRECYLERNTKYDFDTIKALVESKSGTLVYPTCQEEYEKCLNQLKNTKSKHNSPSDLPIEVSCNKGHIPFTTTPGVITQNHWCPLCGERYSVVGTLIHPIFEFLILKLFLLKKCNAKYEKKIFSDKKRLVDILVERDKSFIDKIENKQHTLIVPDYINFLIIDFTIGRNLRNIIDHCERGYQSNDRLLIIVLLRFRDRRDKNEVERIQEDICNNPNIDNNKNIRLFTSDQFLDFLNLNININKWTSNKEDINILEEEIKIAQEYKKNLKIIEDLLSSDVRFEELINKVSKLSDSYKHKLSKL